MLFFPILILSLATVVKFTSSVEVNNFTISSDLYTTWGSRLISGKDFDYALSETLPNSCGIACWSTTSTCAMWRHNKSLPLTDWEFVSFLVRDGTTTVPFCHDFAVTLENNGTHNALMGYVTPKVNTVTGKLMDAYLGPPYKAICGPDLKGLDQPNYVRNTWLVYKILDSSLPVKVQIDQVFSQKGINNQFKWIDINNKLPPRYRNKIVNPQPMIDSRTGYGTLVGGNRYSIHRSSEVRQGTKEVLVILSTPKQFVFENGINYTEVVRINPYSLQEDGWLETNGKNFTVVYHDQTICTSKKRRTCGGIMYSDDLVTWTNPVILYQSIAVSGKPLYLRQRPSIFRTNNSTYLCTSSAVKNAGFVNGKCNGGSRTLCVKTDLL